MVVSGLTVVLVDVGVVVVVLLAVVVVVFVVVVVVEVVFAARYISIHLSTYNIIFL